MGTGPAPGIPVSIQQGHHGTGRPAEDGLRVGGRRGAGAQRLRLGRELGGGKARSALALQRGFGPG